MDTQYPSFGSSHIDQPKDCGTMSDREQEMRRAKILEGSEFSERLEEVLSDRTLHRISIEMQTFSREEVGLIGYYIGHADKDGLYRFLKELIGKDIESIIRKMEDSNA